jgi:acetylglutamate kinase
VPALGLSGEDGLLLAAAPSADARLGQVGEPARVNVALLALLLGAGYCPVVSPVSASSARDGRALNVNGDDAAAAWPRRSGPPSCSSWPTCPGVLVDGAPVAALDPDEAAALVQGGTAAAGWRPSSRRPPAPLARGVGRVRIGDLAALADPARGTQLTARPTAAARTP